MPNNSILQAVLDEYDDQSLDHYGVKGMRWVIASERFRLVLDLGRIAQPDQINESLEER